MRTTQSWGGVTDVRGLAAGWWPPWAPAPHSCAPPAHRLAHCLSGCPRLSVHLLSQQLCVEEGGFTQVLGWRTGAQELWAMSFLHPDPDLLLVGSPHLAELGA